MAKLTLSAQQQEVFDLIEDTRKAFESSADDLVYGVALHSVMEGECDDYE